ncbi:hypothetical protein HDU93_005764 [Gonapodya sp. JEL0774]|nr:hypothetical protein HDU93_005764 [Gonapodya sp. JEL0774]
MVSELSRYWDLGWIAFPITLKWSVEKGKKELMPPKDWSKLTLETAQSVPARNAIAIQTGAGSGIVVVDVDDVEGWQKILGEKGETAPETVTARSQRGGYHYYFEFTEDIADLKSTSALLGGCVDVRNKGGMIIAPQSAFQVPGEATPREYKWLEGKAPWERGLSDMPGWLVRALRESGGGGGVIRGQGGQQGEEAVNTPDAVKDFILQTFTIMHGSVGETKKLSGDAGYVIATSVLECPFKKAAHKSNRQYLHITQGGEITRQCHDGECANKSWGTRKVPSEIVQTLTAMFQNGGIEECVKINCGEETPSEVKNFITKNFGLEEDTLGWTKLAPNGTGYIVMTSVRYCPIAKDSHKQGQQYLFVSAGGEITRRCHDVECKEKIKRRKGGRYQTPEPVMQALRALFPLDASEEDMDIGTPVEGMEVRMEAELIEQARQEAVMLVNSLHKGNEEMAMVHKPEEQIFEGVMEKYYKKDAKCWLCGHGRLVATTSKDGLVIQCTDCEYRSPGQGAMVVETEKYKHLGKYFVMVVNQYNQQINVTNVTVAAEPTATWMDFASEEHVFVHGDERLNKLFLHALSGIHEWVAKLVAELVPIGVAYADRGWWCFEGHRWIEASESEAIEKTVGAPKVYLLFEEAYKHYSSVQSERTDAATAQRAKWVRDTLTQLGKTPYRKNVMDQLEAQYRRVGRTFVKERDDRDELLAFENGVVDLDKLVDGDEDYFREGRAEDYVTLSTDYDFDRKAVDNPDARKVVMDVLEKILPDQATRDYLLTYMSTMLSGSAREQKLVFFTGDGANGKSLIANALKAVLGRYAQTIKSSILMENRNGPRDGEAPTPTLAGLRTARCVIVSEVGAGARLDEEMCKSLTGDEDIAARGLHSKKTEFRFRGKMLLLVNDLPNMKATGESAFAMRRRVRVVRGQSTFVEDRAPDPQNHVYVADKTLGAKVKLSWFKMALLGILFERYKAYRAEGTIKEPVAVRDATGDYLSDSNPVKAFFDDATVPTNAGGTKSSVVFDAFRQWVTTNAPEHTAAVRMWSLTKFSRNLPEPLKSEVLNVDGKCERGIRRRSTSPTIESDLYLAKRRLTTAPQASQSKLYPAELIRTIDAGIVEAQPILNRALKVPVGTEWQVGGDTNLIPRCVMCLVDPKHAHQDTGDSFLRVNLDMTVDAVCRELGERRLRGPVARTVQAAFNIKVPIHHGTKEYEGLRDQVVSYALSRGLQRETGSGWVYKPINGLSYALERWKSPEAYLNIVFRDDDTRTLSKRGHYFDNLVSYLCKVDDECFHFVVRNMRYYGFRNGVYDLEACEFIPGSDVPSNLVARKYIDQEFTGSTETPLFDSIFRDQGHSDEVLRFVDVCLGRLFGIRDDWQFMLMLYGESGTGKSTVLSVMRSFFEQVGSLSSTFERTFGLSAWYDKEIVMGDDLPLNMAQVLPQTVIQTMISNGELTVVPKGKTAFSVKWKVPLLFATNFALDYIDQGQVSRRVLVLSFLERVRVVAPDLVSRIVREELPAVLKRVTTAYKKALELNRGRGVWDFTPAYFIEGQREMRMQSDPVFAFITEHCEYREGSLVTIKTLKEAVKDKTGTVPPSRISHLTVENADERYKIVRIKLCKSCGGEAKKGCCSEYNRAQRTSADAVVNMALDWSPAQAVTTAIAQTSECADWRVEYRTNVLGGGGDGMVDESMEWMNHATPCILAGDVAEAQVKFYLCEGVEFDWRQPIRQNTEVPPHTQADILTYFTKREGTVRAAVQLIKKVTGAEHWEAPTANFRMVTAKHGEVTGRVDFHGRTGGTMYILETKFSGSDLVPGNRHCRQMEMYWRWGVSQPGVEKCEMIFYNVRTGREVKDHILQLRQ